MEQNNQPAPQPQPPYGNVVMQPKKKKVGLIIGIVAGVLALIAIIAAVLLYFLWWQNPQKMVTDALSNTITAKKATANGKIIVNMQDSAKLELNVKAASASAKSKVNIDATLTVKDLEKKFSIKGDIVIDTDGTLYVKVDNFKDLYSDILEALMEAQVSAASALLTKDQIQTYRDQVLQRLDSQLNEVNGKWMKISPDEFADTDYKCYIDVLKKARSNDGVRKEIAQIYQQNSFLDVKDTKVSDRNGGRGFEVEGNRDKAKKFAEQLKDSSIGKEAANCRKVNTGNITSATESAERSTAKIWVDNFSHELKGVEIKGKDGKTSTEISLDVTMDKADDVNIPSDAGSLKDFLNGFMSGLSSGGLSSID